MSKQIKILSTKTKWEKIFEDENFTKEFFDKALPKYLPKCRWFGGKSKSIKQISAREILKFSFEKDFAHLLILEIVYYETYSESYFLPLYFCREKTEELEENAVIGQLTIGNKEGYVIDALYQESVRNALFRHIYQEKCIEQESGSLIFERGSMLDNHKNGTEVKSIVLKADQSNTSLIFNDQFFLKIYRHLFRDTNPDYEITKLLTESAGFENSPRYAGSMTWKRCNLPNISLGLMQEKVENEGDAWNYILGQIKKYFDKIKKSKTKVEELEKVELYVPKEIKDFDPELVDLMGFTTLKHIEVLARRTAEMHVAVSSERSNYTFMPVVFNEDYSVWLKNRLMYQFDRRVDLVEKTIGKLEGLAKEYAQRFLDEKEEIINTILSFDEYKLISKRIRIHGDYHLGQVLKIEDDFIILDFEGEPESTIRDRKVKQPPIKDVAGMIRSFHYAVFANIFEQYDQKALSKEELFTAGDRYYRCIVALFLNTYLNVSFENSLDIGYQREITYLLKYHLLEKAIYELGYELNSRPTWAIIPLQGIVNLLDNQ